MEKVYSEKPTKALNKTTCTNVALYILCVLSFVLSSVAIMLVVGGQMSSPITVDGGNDVSELRRRLDIMEQIVQTLSKKLSPEVEIDFHTLYKRDTGDDQKDSLLSQLSVGDLSHLSGPAGLDGRDGRDGRDCDTTECSAAAAESDSSVQIQRILELLSNRSSSLVSSTTTQSSMRSQAQFNQAELLAAFNETIAYGILRSIQQTNSKLDQLENDLNQQSDVERKSGVTQTTTDTTLSSPTEGGSTYIRWGRTSCSNSSQRLYAGIAAGQHYTQTGGASNYQCLPQEPEYNDLSSGTSNWINGAEYETGNNIFSSPTNNQNVPCAACYTQQRSATIMIPAIRTCPDSWTKEYEGYLMSGLYSHKRAYEFVCVDGSPESIPGGHTDLNGALFYFVQGSCGTLGRCPPYIDAAELTCVVCSK